MCISRTINFILCFFKYKFVANEKSHSVKSCVRDKGPIKKKNVVIDTMQFPALVIKLFYEVRSLAAQ